MNLKNLVIFLIVFSGCGLRITNEQGENIFLGSWKLESIICYENTERSAIIEKYNTDSVVDIVLKFSGNIFEYSANGSCTTSAYGRYKTEFNGDAIDYMDLFNMITGSTCDISMTDAGPNLVGTFPVSFTVLPIEATNLYWIYNPPSLELQFPTSFKGSSSVGGCNGVCVCMGDYTKI